MTTQQSKSALPEARAFGDAEQRPWPCRQQAVDARAASKAGTIVVCARRHPSPQARTCATRAVATARGTPTRRTDRRIRPSLTNDAHRKKKIITIKATYNQNQRGDK